MAASKLTKDPVSLSTSNAYTVLAKSGMLETADVIRLLATCRDPGVTFIVHCFEPGGLECNPWWQNTIRRSIVPYTMIMRGKGVKSFEWLPPSIRQFNCSTLLYESTGNWPRMNALRDVSLDGYHGTSNLHEQAPNLERLMNGGVPTTLRFPNLKTLSFFESGLFDTVMIDREEHFPNLEDLTIRFSYMFGTRSEFTIGSEFQHLKRLVIEGGISIPVIIRKPLPALERIESHVCPVRIAAACHRLTHAAIWAPKILKWVGWKSNAPNLTHLKVVKLKNSEYSTIGAPLVNVAGLPPSIVELDMVDMVLKTTNSARHLPALRTLRLRTWWPQLVQLRKLPRTITKIEVSDADVKTRGLASAFPNLVLLSVRDSRLTSNDGTINCVRLRDVPNSLRELRLIHCAFDGRNCRAQLESVHLEAVLPWDGTRLTQFRLSGLPPSVTSLSVERTKMVLPDGAWQFPNLKELTYRPIYSDDTPLDISMLPTELERIDIHGFVGGTFTRFPDLRTLCADKLDIIHPPQLPESIESVTVGEFKLDRQSISAYV
jgi:hypothetical protein